MKKDICSWEFFSLRVPYTHIITHLYEYMYIHYTLINISRRLSRLDLEIHEVDHQEHIAVDEDITSH
jgi:hypothetical protein